MRALRYTDAFASDVARLKRRGADFGCFKEVVARLAEGRPLPGGYDDRPVPGEVSGLRCCRIPAFGYLLYRCTDAEVVLVRAYLPWLRRHMPGYTTTLLDPGNDHPRRVRPAPQRTPIMIRNDLKTALRHVRRQKGYAFLNVGGLAVGLACCLLILLFVRDELSYDRHHAAADRIYRVVDEEHKEGGIVARPASTPVRLAPLLDEEVPAVEAVARFMRYSVFTTPLVSRDGEEKFSEPGFFFADSTAFDVFSFPFLRGDPATALGAPMSVVLTAAAARKYFGEEDPMGQTLTFENAFELKVTGVLRDLPANTHLRFDFLAAFSSLRQIEGDWLEQSWNWPPVYTYVRLPRGLDPRRLEEPMDEILRRHRGEEVAARRQFSLQPLTSIHLYSHRENELEPGGDAAYVYLFSAVALVILLLACINFMNLATARSAQRAREVGLRKVMGAQRGQLVRQFVAESVLAAAMGLVLAVGLVVVSLPVFNDVSGKALDAAALLGGGLPLVLVAGVVVVGLVAGSYPAFYLSAFRPVRVLKGGPGPRGRAGGIRKGLVVFQFAVSCVLLVGTAVIYRQLDFVQHSRLGFDKEHVVVMSLPTSAEQESFRTLKEQFEQHPRVRSVTATSGIPPSTEGVYDFPIVLRGEHADSLEIFTLTIDHDFAETYGIEVVEGRDLSEDYPTDAAEGVLLNEAAVRKLGLASPVGQEITLYHYANGRVPTPARVVGVLRDFHYESLRHSIDPLLFYILPPGTRSSYYDYLSVRVDPTDVEGTLAFLERTWQAFSPDRPFTYSFLDAHFDALYRAEQRLGTLFGYFSLLAVVVACLGLFGLAAFSAEQRTKEIGVRKVMGASTAGIVLLLSKDFVRLVAVAFVVAVPVSYVAMHHWLEAFAYRIDLSRQPGLFVMAGVVALLIALLTVGYQAIRAALTDPVRALRHE